VGSASSSAGLTLRNVMVVIVLLILG
jgi:hypothetical protein